MMPIGISTMPARKVEFSLQKEVEVCLLQFDLAFLLETLHQCVLEFELAHEAKVGRKAVIDQKDEPMEIEHTVLTFFLVEVEIHVAEIGPVLDVS